MFTTAVAENGKKNTIQKYNRSGATRKKMIPRGINAHPMGVTSKNLSP
jgi:hypothetical protein